MLIAIHLFRWSFCKFSSVQVDSCNVNAALEMASAYRRYTAVYRHSGHRKSLTCLKLHVICRWKLGFNNNQTLHYTPITEFCHKDALQHRRQSRNGQQNRTNFSIILKSVRVRSGSRRDNRVIVTVWVNCLGGVSILIFIHHETWQHKKK